MNKKLKCISSVGLFAVVVTMSSVFMVLIVGCPTVSVGGGTTNGNSGVTGKFVGAETCLACHADDHANWSNTGHAGALETLEAIGQGENASCLGCHTVGFGEDGGFVDRATTNALVGVQCENCHGSGRDHVDNAIAARDEGATFDESLKPVVNLSAQMCGTCHTDAHHPTFDEWKLSKHSTALEGLRSNPFANDSCLECHSQDFRYQTELATETGDLSNIPTLDSALFSIECVSCHAPHGGVAQNHQLRMPVADLCGECHTQEEATLGSTPHHPQIEMVTGTGGFAADGTSLVQAGPHSSLFASDGEACAQCHVVTHDVDEPNDGNPNITGHTFNPFDEDITTISPEHQAEQFGGCLICHTAEGAQERFDRVQTDIAAKLDALSPFFDADNPSFIDKNTLTIEDQLRYETAQFNFKYVEADGSQGVHNASYARALLDIAETILNDLAAT